MIYSSIHLIKTVHFVLFAGVVVAASTVAVRAQGAAPDLANATLEELMNIQVTSAARKSQRAEDVPAAIYVITGRDIRESGLMTLPEVLRLAPGVQVAQVSSSKWAVSIRGFNSPFSNKLLVLIDGRSVYSRAFSGVFWDLQEVMVSDIERIEVIRGPGGVAWGANAVNGVISIMTRPATEQQGLDLRLSAGTFARAGMGIRYGGTVGNAAYRVFSQFSKHADSWPGERSPLSDNWHSSISGVRIDWSRGAHAFLAQGHVATNRTRAGWMALPSLALGAVPATDGVSQANEGSALARWTRTWTSGTALQVQGYHTTTRRDEPIIQFTESTSDIDAQYETRFGSRNSLMFGGGYRHVDVSVDNTVTAQMGAGRIETFNTFLQDEVSVRPGVALTLGSKLEYDTFGGWGVLPSARAIWEASPGQRLWAAVSRTRRTPSNADRTVQLNVGVMPGQGLPVLLATKGNPNFRSERLVQLEVGHRIRLGSTASFETTVFTGSYDDLSTSEPFQPIVELTPAPAHVLAGAMLGNLQTARASGVELNARWNPLARWEIETSYSGLRLTVAPDPASLDALAATADGDAPNHQWHARTTIALRPGVGVGASIWHVGKLHRLAVPAYTRVDANAEFRLNRRLSALLVGQNLSNGNHVEFASQAIFLTSRLPRSARLDLRWEF
jgi:iron complex outermembrane recepter protein